MSIDQSDDYQFDFAEWPFYWLARAERSYLMRMERALAPHGLDIPAWRVLSQLHQKAPATVSELAYHAIVKLPTMTKIIQRMQGAGLVECRVSPRDARATEVVLTPDGAAAGRIAWEEAERIYRETFRDFTARQKLTLITLLRRVSQKLEV